MLGNSSRGRLAQSASCCGGLVTWSLTVSTQFHNHFLPDLDGIIAALFSSFDSDLLLLAEALEGLQLGAGQVGRAHLEQCVDHCSVPRGAVRDVQSVAFRLVLCARTSALSPRRGRAAPCPAAAPWCSVCSSASKLPATRALLG